MRFSRKLGKIANGEAFRSAARHVRDMWLGRTPSAEVIETFNNDLAHFNDDLVHTYQIARRMLLTRGLWSLFDARREGEDFRFRGFGIPPRDLPMALRFFVNGSEAHIIGHPDDPYVKTIAARFALREIETTYSFSCSIPLLRPSDTLRIEFRPGAGAELFPYQDWYVRLQAELQPDSARRVRVAHTADVTLFESMGYTACAVINRALQEYFDRDLGQCSAILDWGCGCGRVGRFVARRAPGKLVGVDIDSNNVGWCQQHIDGADFQVIGVDPPTQLESNRFDLVYGISVFTHLGEADQDRWLAELHRLTKPGGAVMMSIHSELAFCRDDSDLHRFLTLGRDGFFVLGRCSDLDEAIPAMKQTSYYKNVFHSRYYIHQHWSQYFEVIDVLDGAMHGHQDLVIMRR